MNNKFLEIKERFKKEFDDIIIEDTIIILEEYFDDGGACKNDDDCYDQARDNAHKVMEIFPELEIVSYYCHKSKYAICELKINTLIYDIN